MNSPRMLSSILVAVLLSACTSRGLGIAPTAGTANELQDNSFANRTSQVQRAAGYKIIHNFGKTVNGRHVDGAYPQGAVLFVNGALYGTTGGPSGVYNGTIFTMMPDGSGYRTLRDFTAALRNPHGLIAFDGAFYGTGSGSKYLEDVLFSVAMSGKLSVLHVFGKGGDGAYATGLTAANGQLYGMTYGGGASGRGVIYNSSVTGSNYRVLHSFGKGADGSVPVAAPLLVSNTLYGMTSGGGAYHKGTIFRIATSGSGERVLHSFGSGKDGSTPQGALILVKGTLYGTTFAGGTRNKGTVFAINPDGANERVLHSFGVGKDGQAPWPRLAAVNGVLYGTTTAGGTYNRGVVFSIGTSGTNEQVLHDFGDTNNDGFGVSSPLTYDGGTLYGLTLEGGSYLQSGGSYPDYGGGTAFAITP